MTDDKALKAKIFFSMGIAFDQFSEKPDREKYELIYQGASSLKLEVPSYDELLAERLYWGVAPPKKWFEGSEGKSMKNYFQIGILSCSIFLSFLKNKKINSDSVQELKVLFRAVSIPIEILENWLMDLKTVDFSGSYSRFRENFFKEIDERYIELKNYYDKASNFFSLGLCFGIFLLVPNRDIYQSIYEMASSQKLEVPDYDELLAERDYWILPEKWFEGSEGKSLRNYFQIGIFSSILKISALVKNKEVYSDSVQKLRVLFRAESIPTEILENWLMDLKTGQVYVSFVRYIHNFYKMIGKKDTESNVNMEDRLKFSHRAPTPSFFNEDVVKDIKDKFEKVSGFYENQDYESTVMECGKIVEILIKNVYEPLMGQRANKKNKRRQKIERSFKQMLDFLAQSDKCRFFDKRVLESLALIYGHRSGVAHGDKRKPGKDIAYSIALLTNDFKNSLFEYLNEHPLDSK